MIKTNHIHSILIFVIMGILSACATDGGGSKQVSSKPLTKIEKQMSRIMAASVSQEIFFIEVPSPNDFISEKLMLATMSLGGGSTAIDQLSELLKKNVVIHIGIVGKSQAINVMTVKQSLKNMADKSAKGNIYLIADEKEKSELVEVNKNKNINIVVVQP